MIELDETKLTAFFSVTPQPQSSDEIEFFAAPFFVKSVDGIRLEFSISAYHCDLRLDLYQERNDSKLAGYILREIESITIGVESDGRKCLFGRTKSDEVVAISVEPTITVRFTNNPDDSW